MSHCSGNGHEPKGVFLPLSMLSLLGHFRPLDHPPAALPLSQRIMAQAVPAACPAALLLCCLLPCHIPSLPAPASSQHQYSVSQKPARASLTFIDSMMSPAQSKLDKGERRQPDILPDLCVQNCKPREMGLFLMKIQLPVLTSACVCLERGKSNLLHIHPK